MNGLLRWLFRVLGLWFTYRAIRRGTLPQRMLRKALYRQVRRIR